MQRKSAYSRYNRVNFSRPFNLDSPMPTKSSKPKTSINNTLIESHSQRNDSIIETNDSSIKQKNSGINLNSNSNNNSNIKTTNDTLNIFAHSNTNQPTKYTPPAAIFKKPAPIKIPSKKRSFQDKENPIINDKLTELEDADISIKSKGLIECPYCHTILADNISIPLPRALQDALDEIKNADKQYKDYRKQENYHIDLPKRRRVTNMDQFTFCQLHRLELIIKPEGIKNGYPIDIDFKLLEMRVKELHTELLKLINNKTDCHFRKIALKAYNKLGKHRARNTISVMNRFEDTLPGYYGPKGATVIIDTLTKMFLHSGIITKEKVQPQLPVEYIQQVLVPETGLLLIQDDIKSSSILNKHNDEAIKDYSFPKKLKNQALKIMINSRDFGNNLYPAEDDAIDSNTVQNVDNNVEDNSDDDNGKQNELNSIEDKNEKLEFVSSLDEENE